MRKWGYGLVKSAIAISLLAACQQTNTPGSSTSTGEQAKSRLEIVKSRGKLICGISGELPGFSFLGTDGKYSGLDVDFCRAIAAALFDNPDAVEYRKLNAKERFTALQTGEIDVLSRNTSWTLSRDAAVGLEFAPVLFYDGQGMMVKKDSGIKTLAELKDKSICTQIGTTNEQNLSDRMREQNIPYKPVVFEDINTAYATYAEGRCQAVTSDRSQLLSRRSTLPQPENHVILDASLSKEPLAPAVLNGDSRWFDAVKWVAYSLINAEELGVTSQNLAQIGQSSNPEIKRFVGTEGSLGEGLGLTNDFAARVVKHVGNYGEMYERNLGANTPFKLPRGLNNLWTKGGLLYAPPFR